MFREENAVEVMHSGIDNFSTNSLALEFASTSYIPDDYIRNYDDYLQLRGNGEI